MNFDPDNQESVAKFVAGQLTEHRLMALATISGAGTPWVVCVGCAIDDNFNIIWPSRKDAEHSKHISNNSNIAICIFNETEDGKEFGFYAKATAREVSDPDKIAQCIKLRYERSSAALPEISRFSGDNPERFYCAELAQA